MQEKQMQSDDFPIFVLSMKRSGSTLMRNIMDAHPEVFSPALEIGTLCHAVYDTNYLALGNLTKTSTEAARKDLAVQRTRHTVSSMIERFLEESQKRRWCDKTLANLYHLDLIKQVFPEARYVILYRHCLDVVQSYLSFSKIGFLPEICEYVKQSPENLVSALVRYWVDTVGLLHSFEQRSGEQCIRLNYEALVLNPERTLQELFEFLRLPWSAGLLQSVFSQNNKALAEGDVKFHFTNRIHAQSLGGGASLPLAAIGNDLFLRMTSLLSSIGYEVEPQSLFNFDKWRSSSADPVSESDNRVLAVEDGPQSGIVRFLAERLAMKSDYAKAIGGVCNLIISGADGKNLVIDGRDQPKVVGGPSSESDCTITLSAKTMNDLIEKRRGIADVFSNGELLVVGNIELATSFGKLLFAE